MWGDILSMALFVSLNPVLLGFILLVISRPRPLSNLLAFWIGAMIVNVPAFVVPVLVLHAVPSFASAAQDLVNPSPTSGIQPLQLCMGIAWLVIAALLVMRIRQKKRVEQTVPAGPQGHSSTLVLDGEPERERPAPGRIRTAWARIYDPLRRLFHRLHEAWENGALWIGLVFGMGYIAPPPLVLLVATLIAGSGAAIGTQVVASVVFVFAMLIVFEIALLSYVVSPARTAALLEPLHEWSRKHRLLVLAVLFTLIGIWQTVKGSGLI
ncbi:hypothetical protein A5733_01045 [Mycobacterium sp. NS-7484]|uniref:GAP family protein n=1 Tax=Mycobacterium sp. NS-7484 TaxID=1834161 RepID=UPI00096F3895|nr:GAP family protein [Mycobacterium sp. NS-7484]OMB99289.1 hypothetical protein A5733_01045 [Mycobacterium sp. NS-7484]